MRESPARCGRLGRSAHIGLYTVHSDRVYARGDRGRRVGLIGLQAVDVVAVYRRSPPVSLPQKLIQERMKK